MADEWLPKVPHTSWGEATTLVEPPAKVAIPDVGHKAVVCPVCGGSGRFGVPSPPLDLPVDPTDVVCHGCGGKGWVVIPE